MDNTTLEIVPVLWLLATTLFSFVGQGTIFTTVGYFIWHRYMKKEIPEAIDYRDVKIDLLKERVDELVSANRRLEDANGRIITMTLDRLTREQ